MACSDLISCLKPILVPPFPHFAVGSRSKSIPLLPDSVGWVQPLDWSIGIYFSTFYFEIDLLSVSSLYYLVFFYGFVFYFTWITTLFFFFFLAEVRCDVLKNFDLLLESKSKSISHKIKSEKTNNNLHTTEHPEIWNHF